LCPELRGLPPIFWAPVTGVWLLAAGARPSQAAPSLLNSWAGSLWLSEAAGVEALVMPHLGLFVRNGINPE